MGSVQLPTNDASPTAIIAAGTFREKLEGVAEGTR
jgi:hypothetical protein